MRTPQRLTDKDGQTYYRVRYRRQGKQRSATFYGPAAAKDAEEFTRLLDTLGVDRAVAYWNAHLEGANPDAMTLDEWFDRYLRALTGITDGTRITYERTYRRVWQPRLGGMPIDTIRREDIAEVVNDLATEKADKTIRNAYGILAQALKVAVRDGHLPISPCVGIRLPRRTQHIDAETRFLTHAEWQALTVTMHPHYLPLFTTLIGTGIRWGEAEALTVADVILDPSSPAPAVLRVNKAAKWNASQATREVGPTKTKKSNRTVTIPGEVLEVLAPLLEGRRRTERLFLGPTGAELRHSTVYPIWLQACEDAGLGEWEQIKAKGKATRRKWRGPRIHDLRHTHVSWLIAAGVPLPVIQARLGHENITTTIDRYGHLLPDLQVAAANAASLAMRGSNPLAIG